MRVDTELSTTVNARDEKEFYSDLSFVIRPKSQVTQQYCTMSFNNQCINLQQSIRSHRDPY